MTRSVTVKLQSEKNISTVIAYWARDQLALTRRCLVTVWGFELETAIRWTPGNPLVTDVVYSWQQFIKGEDTGWG
jgi:N6-adenosine-specific RNA methylase IME4